MYTITCEWVEYHDDMYPEFAPEPLVSRCLEQATERFAYSEGEGGLADRIVLCAKHSSVLRDDEAVEVHEAEPVTEDFARGYANGQAEAEVYEMTEDQWAEVVHEHSDDWSEDLCPRSVIDGQWADEPWVGVESRVEAQAGFDRGWTLTLELIAARRYDARSKREA